MTTLTADTPRPESRPTAPPPLLALPPLMTLRILASRAGLPVALLVDSDGAPGAGLGAALAAAGAPALASDFPCFYRPALGGPAIRALDAAGWEPMAPGALFRADDKLVAGFIPAGVQWIDGDWCLAPPAAASAAQAASRALALQLLQLVAADADTHDIEALLRRDPTLSYQLLRLVNSLGMGVVRRISSFSQALLILGRQQLRRWLNLMLFAAREGDLRSPMLLARVAVRARALELLARARGADRLTQDQAFMTGMFSLLGVLFGMPLPELLAPLSLSVAVQDALLRREGELGALLQLADSAERGDFGAVAAQLDALQIVAADFNLTMVDATSWMLGALRESRGRAYA